MPSKTIALDIIDEMINEIDYIKIGSYPKIWNKK